MKKILHITPEIGKISSGGIGSLCTELFKNKNENEFFLFCNIWNEKMSEKEAKELLENEIEFSTIRTYIDKINLIQPDVIIFHAMILARYFIENNKNNVTKNIWLLVHNNPFLEKAFINTVFEGYTTYEFIVCAHKVNLITISDYETEIISNLFELPKERIIKRIYNGIRFNNNFNFQNITNFKYGYIGRLEERKGIFHLCNQFKEIDRKLLLATGKNENKNLDTMLSMSINKNNNIVPIGWSVGKRRDNFYENISALIVPSIYEPFGMIFLEASNRMKIIIANKTKSSVEILGEDYPFYFNIGDENSLKNTIIYFESFSNKELENIAVRTKKRLISMFSIEKTINEYKAL